MKSDFFSFLSDARKRTFWLQLSPILVWLFVFFALPMMLIVVYSFGIRTQGGGIDYAFTFDNYVRYFKSNIYVSITLRSIYIALQVTIITLLLSYPVAYYLTTTTKRMRATLLVLLILPWWTSILVKNFSWVSILSDRGMVNSAMLWLGVIDEPVRLLYNQFSIVVGLVHLLIPFMTLPIFTTIDKMDSRLLEAGKNLGSSPMRCFWEITLPLSMAGVAGGCIITFILAFGSFVTPVLLGSPRQSMAANIIEDQFLQSFHWPFGAAVAIILLLLVLSVLFVFNKLVDLERIWGKDG